MIWIPTLFLAAAIATGCGNSVQDLKFSEQGQDNNWNSVFKAAVMSDAISKEDKILLQDAILREKQQIPPAILGKTVRQVIEDQKVLQKANQTK